MVGSESHLLLVDVGNSFTKLALATPVRLVGRRRLPTSSLDRHALIRAVRGWQFGRVVVSSVVPARTGAVRSLMPERVLEVSHRVALGVGIDYPRPATIGADRLANAAAVVALHGVPAVVVDFGTAVTFDVVSREGRYVGGAIAPGLAAMTDYLHACTALLPRISIREPVSAVGRSTREAMRVGAVIGYRGLIDRILKEIGREIAAGSRLQVVATGGYAALIVRGLPSLQRVDPDLTLHGLQAIARLNPAPPIRRRARAEI